MLQEYIHSVKECSRRVHRLNYKILQLMSDYPTLSETTRDIILSALMFRIGENRFGL